MRTVIVGAGIVGVSTAHALLDEGHDVSLVDSARRAGRASLANAGWIADADIMPLASPKVWRHVPRWLLDPLGPLAVRPGYLPRITPWLVRFILASFPSRIEASIEGIRALNARALPAWRRRLGKLDLHGQLVEKGALSVWRRRGSFEQARRIIARQQRYGIAAQEIAAGDLAGLEPALRNVEAAVVYPDLCHVSDPAGLCEALLHRALARGARHVQHDATAIEREADRLRLRLGDGADAIDADRIVVAAGAWSGALTSQMGDRIPLDTERGYNATFAPGTLGLARPVMFEGEGFVTTPLGIGDRVGGMVEFAGLRQAPDHRRTDAIVLRLREFLPHLDPWTPGRRWMGFRPSMPDSLPVIGRAARDGRVLYNFGHGHHGLTQAAASAEIIADLIAGRAPSIDMRPFTPGRFRAGFSR
ncbi:NAD(P)/FAD-dependent oxidoreductase [Vineibacter terrae]|uniref:NAD(P)/FAD-dependent oxidoreductase n=1 Tax=Vineibacter terrae TaxID=2586908 RepID=UPI002E365E63|nr:FAD-dependent oxidoreductase [Vineibacter terrae]HEX2884786.1 FAD-dependent oxidoreductase [Vineibacter terrae]